MTDRSHTAENLLTSLAEWGTIRDVLVQELVDQGMNDAADVIRSEFTPDHANYPDLLANLIIKATDLHPITQSVLRSQNNVLDIITRLNEPVIDQLEGVGSFDDSSDWTLLSGWTVTGGQAEANVPLLTNSLCGTRRGDIVGGARYLVKFDVTSYTSGSINAVFSGISHASVAPAVTSTGSYEFVLSPPVTVRFTGFQVANAGGFVGIIDNLTVHRLG